MQHLTGADVEHREFDKVILPLGSLECHGPHLPFGTDTFTAYLLSLEIAEHVPGTIVLPPVNYGVSEHYRDFSFTVSLRPGTETTLIEDILESIYREGIRKCFIFNGHDGNISSIEIASRNVKVLHPDLMIVSLDAWWQTLIPLLPSDFFEVWQGLGHGGEGEMSISLALFPELCRPDVAVGVVPNLPPQLDVKWLFTELTNCGATGDPTKGTTEKGRYMKQVLVDTIVSGLISLDACGWDYRSPVQETGEKSL
ncbi:MAG: creatininase family protein [Methanospirillum sp.]|uniref:creatininase family protein n=1 Tax=Methanospirillum sp. TaxID=45200 RepID=UPI0023750429|nr:creatininase family protein [Methanospirillum sp.]MDD1728477.1 creatininase family protein [Methanospirillum sp.]